MKNVMEERLDQLHMLWAECDKCRSVSDAECRKCEKEPTKLGPDWCERCETAKRIRGEGCNECYIGAKISMLQSMICGK